MTPSLFRKRAFTGGLLAGIAFFSGMIGFSLVFSLYLQIGLGYSPLKTGLAGVPQALGMVIGFVVAGAGLSAKLGRRLLHLGLAVMAAGVALFAVILHAAGTGRRHAVAPGPGAAVVGLRHGSADGAVLRHHPGRRRRRTRPVRRPARSTPCSSSAARSASRSSARSSSTS